MSNSVTSFSFFCDGINGTWLNTVWIIKIRTDKVTIYKNICIVSNTASIMC